MESRPHGLTYLARQQSAAALLKEVLALNVFGTPDNGERPVCQPGQGIFGDLEPVFCEVAGPELAIGMRQLDLADPLTTMLRPFATTIEPPGLGWIDGTIRWAGWTGGTATFGPRGASPHAKPCPPNCLPWPRTRCKPRGIDAPKGDHGMGASASSIGAADVPLNRDVFLRRLLRELAGTLQDVVGTEEASGYISVVGAAVGEHIDAEYRRALSVERLSREQVADVLVDLKRRISGDFYVVEEAEDRIVLGNRACPFGEFVRGRPSLCMMTSNVFGYIAAENLGFAGVELERTIAQGHAGCKVVVHLRPSDEGAPSVREYFRRDESNL